MYRYLRYLRITWTVFCGIACVLLIALWIRSYSHCDVIENRKALRGWVACSERGEFLIGAITLLSPVAKSEWKVSSYPPSRDGSRNTEILSTSLNQTVGDVSFGGPYWVSVLVLAILGVWAAVPWIHWKFSLRTLLIATTVVAVALGLIVYATRH